MHRVLHLVHTGTGEKIAQLVRHLVHSKPLAAELEHLRHKRQVLQLAPLVKGGHDFLGAADLD